MKTATAGAAKPVPGATSNKTDAVSLLKADHRKVEQIFASFELKQDNEEK